MKLRLPNHKILDLAGTRVMGTISIVKDDTRSVEDFVNQAKLYIKQGAALLEIGAQKDDDGSKDESRIADIVEAIVNEVDSPVAVFSDSPDIIIKSLEKGASILVTTTSIENKEVLELCAKLKTVLCLKFNESFQEDDENADIVARVSEYFYTEIDRLLNSGIERKHIMLDPAAIKANIPDKLKLLGRLESFNSFGLPICIGLPSHLPVTDKYLQNNEALCLTTALFCASEKSVHIIKTDNVAEIAISLGFWEIMSTKTKPYRLTKTLVRRMRNVRDNFLKKHKK